MTKDNLCKHWGEIIERLADFKVTSSHKNATSRFGGGAPYTMGPGDARFGNSNEIYVQNGRIFGNKMPEHITININEFIKAIEILTLLQPFVNNEIQENRQKHEVVCENIRCAAGISEIILSFTDIEYKLLEYKLNIDIIASKFDEFLNVALYDADTYIKLLKIRNEFVEKLI